MLCLLQICSELDIITEMLFEGSDTFFAYTAKELDGFDLHD